MKTCYANETLAVADDVCTCALNWKTTPGTCRLRITSYSGTLFTPCFGSVPSAAPAWDGTFVNFVLNTYYATSPISIQGKAIDSDPTLVWDFGTPLVWTLYMTSGGDMWTGELNNNCPIGTFTKVSGCSGPASVTVEGYTP